MASSTINGLDSKTLKLNDKLPPATPERMRVFVMRFCPFAERTVIALAHKNIPTDVINVSLVEKPTWLLERNPLGKVPVLEKGSRIIYESGVCNDYLDQVYPQAQILPTDPYLAAQQKMLAERLSGMLIAAFYQFLRAGREGVTEEMRQKVETLKDDLETLLTADFYAGNQMGYADVMSWPWVERLEAFPLMPWTGVTFPDEKRCPKLAAYVKRMKQQRAIQIAIRGGPELEAQFLESVVDGAPNYDVGL